MKKTLKLFLLVMLLALSLVFTLSSCEAVEGMLGNSDGSSNTDGTEGESSDEETDGSETEDNGSTDKENGETDGSGGTGSDDSGSHTHNFAVEKLTDEYIASEANCTDAALYYYSCECGAKGETTFAVGKPLGHSYFAVVTAPTCTDDGYTTYTCACNDTYTDDVTGALGHSYTVYTSNNDATCFENGTKTSVCNNGCGVDSIIADAGTAGHKYAEDGQCQGCERKISIGLAYTLNSDNASYSVSGIGTCTDTDLVIPDTHEGLPITAIANSAFKDCKSFKSIEIPESVTLICYHAFYYCDVESVIIRNGLKKIERYAFVYCKNIKELIIPESVNEIECGAFSDCAALEIITLPFIGANRDSFYPFGYVFGEPFELKEADGVTSQVYAGGTGYYLIPKALRSVTITGGYIRRGAFYNCKMLTEVNLPNDISIGQYAFYGCHGITTITIPESVTEILDSAFENSGLKSITIPGGVKTLYKDSFRACESLSEVTINYGLETICTRAFQMCDSLKSIVVPGSVIKIEGAAFADCNSLEEITLPFVGDSIKSASDTYQYPLGYIFRSGGDYGGIYNNAASQTYYGASVYVTTTYYLPKTLKTVIITGGEILDGAFMNCTWLTEIELPSTMKAVGSSSFTNCTSLRLNEYDNAYYLGNKDNPYLMLFASKNKEIENCVIHEDTKLINASAFSLNTNLKGISFPNNLTYIGKMAFGACYSLTEIMIPDNVLEIDAQAFSGCNSVTSLTIGKGITFIPDDAFSSCSSLVHVSIPDKVTSIGNYAFRNCTNLMSVTLGSGITKINSRAFEYCESLCRIVNNSDLNLAVGSANNGYVSYYARMVIDKNENESYRSGVTECEEIITEDGFVFVKEDDTYTLLAYFGDNDDVIFPSDINGSTYGIYRMRMFGAKRVTILGGITSIGDYAFSSNYALVSISIPSSVTKIGMVAFEECKNLESVEIANGLQTIGWEAFRNCTSLKSIIIPDSVVEISRAVFRGCTGLESITLPFVGSAKKTEKDAIQFPFGYIFGEAAYQGGVATKQYFIHSSATGGYATYYIPENLKTVVITGGDILKGAFQSCGNLTNITLPATVTGIRSSAFSNCTSLEAILIPEGVTKIDSSAFLACTSLKNILIPGGVTSIATDAFSKCDAYISVSEDNQNFAEIEGIIYDKALTSIIYVNKNVKNVVIPKGVKTLGTAFSENTMIETISFEDGTAIKTIYGFKNCTSLKSIVIPKSATSISSSAFDGCTSLETVLVLGDVTSIGTYAFRGCVNLKSISIPDSVTEISLSAFENCAALESVDIGNGVVSIGNSAFLNCTSLKSIVLPESVVTIGMSAFSGCTSLKSIVLPESVTTIGTGVFYGCTSLETAVFKGGITVIQNNMFFNCTSLKSVVIPSSLTAVNSNAFYGCSALTDAYYGSDQSSWSLVSVSSTNNKALKSAKMYFFSATKPETEGSFWYYDENGNVAVW